MGIVLPTLIALLVGLVIFRKKIAGVFISVITLSLVLLVRLLIIDAQPITNGWNGLTVGWDDPHGTASFWTEPVSIQLVTDDDWRDVVGPGQHQ